MMIRPVSLISYNAMEEPVNESKNYVICRSPPWLTFLFTLALIYVNAGGPSEDGYAGLSQLAVPIKGSIGKHETPAEGMSIAELDMAILDAAEEMYKIRADIAREDWHYDYRKGSEKENSL
jgi:hypothetical protein